MDPLIALGLVVLGALWVRALQGASNPEALPYGVDYRDYLGYVLAFLEPDLSHPDHFRYPMFAWLAAQLCRLQGVPPAVGAMQVSLASSALLPAALYLLGRQLAPRPVVLLAGLWVLQLPPMMQTLGMPSDYIFCAVLQVMLLAAGIWALARGGWLRFLLFGCASAAMLGATAKGFTLVVPALGFVLSHAAIAAVRRRPRAWLPPLVWSAPVVLLWGIYSQHDLQAHALEYQIWNVRNETMEQLTGQPLPVPEGLGWGERGAQAEMGHWRVGQARSLRELPRVLGFFAWLPGHGPPGAAVREGWARGVREATGSSDARFLWLLVPGCLAAAVLRRAWARLPTRREGMLGWALAVGFLASVVVGQWLGAQAVMYRFRYLQPSLVSVPTLALAGVVAPLILLRRGARPAPWFLWLPVPLVLLVVLLGRGPLGFEQAVGHGRKDPRGMHPLPDLVDLIPRLQPGDGIADATLRHQSWYLLWGQGVALRAVGTPNHEHGQLTVEAPGEAWARRFIVQECRDEAGFDDPGWPYRAFDRDVAAQPERFLRRGPCLVEDLEPDQPLRLGFGDGAPTASPGSG